MDGYTHSLSTTPIERRIQCYSEWWSCIEDIPCISIRWSCKFLWCSCLCTKPLVYTYDYFMRKMRHARNLRQLRQAQHSRQQIPQIQKSDIVVPVNNGKEIIQKKIGYTRFENNKYHFYDIEDRFCFIIEHLESIETLILLMYVDNDGRLLVYGHQYNFQGYIYNWYFDPVLVVYVNSTEYGTSTYIISRYDYNNNRVSQKYAIQKYPIKPQSAQSRYNFFVYSEGRKKQNEKQTSSWSKVLKEGSKVLKEGSGVKINQIKYNELGIGLTKKDREKIEKMIINGNITKQMRNKIEKYKENKMKEMFNNNEKSIAKKNKSNVDKIKILTKLSGIENFKSVLNKYPIELSSGENIITFEGEQVSYYNDNISYYNDNVNKKKSYDKSIKDIFGTVKLIGANNEKLDLTGPGSIYKYVLSTILDIYRNVKDSSMKTIWFHSFNEIRKKQLEFISVVLNEAVKIFSDLETQNLTKQKSDRQNLTKQKSERQNLTKQKSERQKLTKQKSERQKGLKGRKHLKKRNTYKQKNETHINKKTSPFDQWCRNEKIDQGTINDWKEQIENFVDFTMNNFIHDNVKKILQPEITPTQVVVQKPPTFRELTVPTLQNMIRF